jgi:phenylpropionate dioxygenase-like ring-hydroxylating dioxygenase large terminal subunit
MSRNRIADVADVLLDYVERGKTFQTDNIMTIPARSYTDSGQWRAEIDLIFKRVPLMLALSCEMPKPGDYKAMEAVGLPILISRNKAEKVHAFLNVCAHRWAPVAAEGYGNCSRFACPFHGWAYGDNGKLIGITDRAKFGDVDRSTHGLKELPCEERHGMIFVCLTPGKTLELDGYYGALLEEYGFAGLKDWTFLGSRVIEGANWKLTFNNFLESYHFATLHAKTVALDALSNVTHYEGFGPNIRTAFLRRSIMTLRDVPREQWGEQEGGAFGFIRIFFPNVTGFLASKSELSLFTQSFPGPTPDKCRIVSLFLRREAPKDETDRENIENQINYTSFNVARDEDNAICLQIQKSLESGAHDGLLYGRNERANQYFHEWLNWYLRDDPSSPKPAL